MEGTVIISLTDYDILKKYETAIGERKTLSYIDMDESRANVLELRKQIDELTAPVIRKRVEDKLRFKKWWQFWK